MYGLTLFFIDSRDLRINYDTGELLWSHYVDNKLTEEVLDQSKTCILTTEAPLCYSIAQMYARYNVILDKYCDYMERFGIPNISVIMPNGGDKDKYLQSANAAQEGENVIWPPGTVVDFAPVDKQTAPFIEFLDYIDKDIVKLCTGGVLTSLAEATGMGSGVSDSQDTTWAEVTASDAIDIASEISRVFSVKFFIDKDITTDSSMAIEQAVALTQAGYTLDDAEITNATGWKVKRG